MENKRSGRANSTSNGSKCRKLTLVLKVGSSSLQSPKTGDINLTFMSELSNLVCTLRRQGHRVVLVSSGAVAMGCHALGMESRPTSLVTKQAVAAVGQSRLMTIYDNLFGHFGQRIAQVLLTRDNLNRRVHYLNALNTFQELLRLGIVPVVNENDTVSVEELRLGDNDTLSAMVAGLVRADFLFLLTDVAGLYDKNPNVHQDARRLRLLGDIDRFAQEGHDAGEAAGGSKWGTGGMVTKLQAGQLATAAGVCTVICGGSAHTTFGGDGLAVVRRVVSLCSNKPDSLRTTHTQSSAQDGYELSVSSETAKRLPEWMQVLTRVDCGGTVFLPFITPLRDRKHWIGGVLKPKGVLVVDAGAARALKRKNSLFAAGILAVRGEFMAQSCVELFAYDRQSKVRCRCLDAVLGLEQKQGVSGGGGSEKDAKDKPTVCACVQPAPGTAVTVDQMRPWECSALRYLGRGLANYNAKECDAVKGLQTSEFEGVLKYNGQDEIVHRDNVSLDPSKSRKAAVIQ